MARRDPPRQAQEGGEGQGHPRLEGPWPMRGKRGAASAPRTTAASAAATPVKNQIVGPHGWNVGQEAANRGHEASTPTPAAAPAIQPAWRTPTCMGSASDGYVGLLAPGLGRPVEFQDRIHVAAGGSPVVVFAENEPTVGGGEPRLNARGNAHRALVVDIATNQLVEDLGDVEGPCSIVFNVYKRSKRIRGVLGGVSILEVAIGQNGSI